MHLRSIRFDSPLDDRNSVTREIFDWNDTVRTCSKARFVRNGQREDHPAYGLTDTQMLALGRLSFEPESMLGASRISDKGQRDPRVVHDAVSALRGR
jgi:oleate hydratase